jgi:Thioredoxin-like
MRSIIVIAAMLLASTGQAQVKDADIARAVEEAVAAAVAAAQASPDDPTYAVAGDEGATEEAAAYPGLFDPSRDAMVDVDAALATARASGKHVLLILGGDWCHDSIALNEAMQIPRTQAMLAARYEIVRVHVPFSPRERVLPVAQRFGIAEVEGTPTVLILRPDGTPINLADAPRWRNAASRKPAAIHRSLERAVPAVVS